VEKHLRKEAKESVISRPSPREWVRKFLIQKRNGKNPSSIKKEQQTEI
jgi:hypothetical protein